MVRSAVKLVVWVVNHCAVCRDSCLILVTSEGQARAAIAFPALSPKDRGAESNSISGFARKRP